MHALVIAIGATLVAGCGSAALGGGMGQARTDSDADGTQWQVGAEVMGAERPSGLVFGGYARGLVIDGDGHGLGDGEFPLWFEAGGKLRYYRPAAGWLRGFAEGEAGAGPWRSYQFHGPALAIRAGVGAELGAGMVGIRAGTRFGAVTMGGAHDVSLVSAEIFTELVFRLPRRDR